MQRDRRNYHSHTTAFVKVLGIVGLSPETTPVEAFQKGNVDIPRAPALGLLLENVSLSYIVYQLNHYQITGG